MNEQQPTNAATLTAAPAMVPAAAPQATRRPWEEPIAVAALVLLLAITLLNVATRYVIDESLAWTEEVSVFLMVVLALAGASAVGRADRHIRIEFLLTRKNADGTESPRRGLLIVGAAATALCFFVMAVVFGRWVADQIKFSETSMGLGVPLWWYGIVIPPLCLAIAARAAMVLLRLVRKGGAA